MGSFAHHVLTEPESGQVIAVPAGSRLELRLHRGLGPNPWRVEDLPGHLVPLTETREGFQFLVFGGPDRQPRHLRLVRQRVGAPADSDVRDLKVIVSA